MATMLAPFDERGNLLRRAVGWRWSAKLNRMAKYEEGHWRLNEPFMTKLKYQGYWRGSSAICFEWMNEQGRKFPMFMSDMNELVASGAIVQGAVWGTWRVVKRGNYYGIQRIPDET